MLSPLQGCLHWLPTCINICFVTGATSKFSKSIQKETTSVLDYRLKIVRPDPVAVVNATTADIHPIRPLLVLLFIGIRTVLIILFIILFTETGAVVILVSIILFIGVQDISLSFFVLLFIGIDTFLVILFARVLIWTSPDGIFKSASTLLRHVSEDRSPPHISSGTRRYPARKEKKRKKDSGVLTAFPYQASPTLATGRGVSHP